MRVGGRRRRRHCRRPGIASDREVLAVPYPGFGWPDDSCCLRAAAEGLQPGHPGEQRIEAGSHEIGQPPIKRAAGTGLALADDLPGHPDHHRARRDGLDHDGIGADPAVLADLDRTEDLGPGADDHAVTDGGMAFPANHATAAESDAVIDRDVVADLRGFSDHHAGRVVDEHASTDDGTGVDIYTGQDASEFGSCPREQPGATLPQPVGEAVAPHGVHARVAEDDFQRGRGRRIPLPGSLFRDTSYALAIATICTVFFAVYGMLLLTTQFLQNVRGYTPSVTGLMILPFSAAVAIVSPLVGHLVGRIGARVPILAGLCMLMLGLLMLIFSEHRSSALVLVGLGLCGSGVALCLTPITTVAMTAVPAERAGMASGIMSAQRAIGSTIGFAVLGSVLAAWLSATLEPHLERAVPDPVQRHVLAEIIIDSANPRAHVGGIVPRRHIEHRDPVAIAEEDFIEGIRVALLVATATLAVVFLAGWRWFPRDVHTAGSDAKREAAYSDDRRVRG